MIINHRTEMILGEIKKEKNISFENLLEVTELEEEVLQAYLDDLIKLKLIEFDRNKYFYSGERFYLFFEKILKNYPISNVMSVPIIVEDTTSIYDAVVTIFLDNVGTLYISQNGYLAGVLSRKDIIRSLIGNIDPNKTPVNMIMTRMPNIVVAHPSDSIYDVAKKIFDHQVDSIPIVNFVEEGRYEIIGRATKTTIANLFVRLGENSIVEGIL